MMTIGELNDLLAIADEFVTDIENDLKFASEDTKFCLNEFQSRKLRHTLKSFAKLIRSMPIQPTIDIDI